MKLLNSIRGQRIVDKQAQIYRELLRQEAKIGGQLFPAVESGGRREFFCLDERTWIWHEEWVDKKTGKRQVVTTRYDVRPNGFLKAQDGQGYRYVDAEEAKNLYKAICLYNYRVSNELYGAIA